MMYVFGIIEIIIMILIYRNVVKSLDKDKGIYKR
jgi:hypothetical protein